MDPSLWVAFEKICQLDVSSSVNIKELFSQKFTASSQQIERLEHVQVSLPKDKGEFSVPRFDSQERTQTNKVKKINSEKDITGVRKFSGRTFKQRMLANQLKEKFRGKNVGLAQEEFHCDKISKFNKRTKANLNHLSYKYANLKKQANLVMPSDSSLSKKKFEGTKRVNYSNKNLPKDSRKVKMNQIIRNISTKNQKKSQMGSRESQKRDRVNSGMDQEDREINRSLKNFRRLGNLIQRNNESRFQDSQMTESVVRISKRSAPDSVNIGKRSNSKCFNYKETRDEKTWTKVMKELDMKKSFKNEKVKDFEFNMELFKKYLWKMALGFRLVKLSKFRESINAFNGLNKPLDTSHFVLVNTAISYMHLVKYKNAEKLFSFAFQKEPYESYGLDYYR